MMWWQRLTTCLNEGAFWHAVVLSGPAAGTRILWRGSELLWAGPQGERLWKTCRLAQEADGAPGVLAVDGVRFYVERLMPEPELVICGGGHISRELAALADYMEYPYVILDDRQEFCSPDRFPGARACLCGPFADTLASFSGSAGSCYIIVTRGHQADLACLELVLQKPHSYIGMIGSRKKVARTMNTLLEKGVSQTQLDEVCAPIGLPIGGETPKEIAVSILAQLIQHKNQQQPSGFLDSAMASALAAASDGVLVTIIGKQGSAPRGTGSRMLLQPDGSVCGTIGGGLVEYEARKRAHGMLSGERDERIAVEHYQVHSDSAAALGMWCGGAVEVLFERLAGEERG